jgi:hemerythrin family protein
MKYMFTEDYLTGIATVDAQHGKLFDLANECYELVMESEAADKYDKIVAIIQELAAYAGTHFENEEAYAARVGDPHRFSHRALHLRFMKKVGEIDLETVDENQQEYLLNILDFLARWLYEHIKGRDCKLPHEDGVQ